MDRFTDLPVYLSTMNRIVRLFALLLVRQKRDVVRAEDRAARFESSKRTV